MNEWNITGRETMSRGKLPGSINTVRQVLETRQCVKMFWPATPVRGKAHVYLDIQTANLIMRYYDASDEKTKLTMEKLISINLNTFLRLVDLLSGRAWRHTKQQKSNVA